MNRLLLILLFVPSICFAEYSETDYKNADKNLNATYQEVLAKHPYSKNYIVKAQKLWLETMQADCLAVVSLPYEGNLTSGYKDYLSPCIDTEKLNRIKWLKENYLY